MDHPMSSMGSTSTTNMHKVFTNTQTAPLYSSAWIPTSSGAYAGTCIFLIILAIIARGLIAFKAIMEHHWRALHLKRRYIVVAGKTAEAGSIDADPDVKLASLITAQGVEENVKVVHNISNGPIPWRFSVDLPRAGLFLCIAGVSYLLMLAVMTMNVGYFCSVLGGVFLGELGVGRYIRLNEHAY